MFEGFSRGADAAQRRRLVVSTAASLVVYGALGSGALLLAARSTSAPEEKPVDVVFEPPPAEAPPPAPPVPASMKVKTVAAVRPAAPLVEPQRVSEQKHAEADPSEDAAEVAEGAVAGDPGGREGGAGAAALPPPPPKKIAEAINLPEEAEPPVPAEDNAQPEYPEEARTKGLEGLVILKIVVDENGHVTKIQVLRGDEPFVAAALAVVKGWRYTPAMVDGQTAAVFRIVKVPFRLKG